MTYSSAVREFFNMSVIHPFSSHEGLSQSSFRALPIDTPPTILQKDTQFPSYFRHRANTNSTLLLPRGRYATVFELRSRMSSYAEKRRKLAEEEAKAKEVRSVIVQFQTASVARSFLGDMCRERIRALRLIFPATRRRSSSKDY